MVICRVGEFGVDEAQLAPRQTMITFTVDNLRDCP
jgi:hypothetical protein